MSWYEIALYVEQYNEKIEQEKQEFENQLWMFGDLKAHIANFTVGIKRAGGGDWTYRDFVKLSGDSEQKEEKKEKLTLKKARESLGSTFKLNEN